MEERNAGRGFLILSIAGLVGKLLSAVYMPFLRGIIGVAGYGIYQASYDVFIFIFAVTSLGTQPAVTKVVTELRAIGNHKDALRAMKLARRYLAIIGVVVTAIFMTFASNIAEFVNAPKSGIALFILGPTTVLSAILSSYRGYIQGIEDMTTLAISQVLEQIINVVLSLVFAFLLAKFSLEWGSAGGTVGTSIGALVAIVFIMFIYEKRDYEEEAIISDTSTKKVSDRIILRKLIMYGLPITLVAGMQNAAGIIDVANVNGRLLHAGFIGSEVNSLYGILGSYKTLIYVPLTIVTALGTAIFPKIIQAFVERNKKELKKQMSYSFRITYMITIPATFGLAVLAKPIYEFLFGTSQGYELLMYGSCVLIFMSITTIQNTILQGINKLYLILATAGLGIIIKFIANYFLVGIKEINIMGAVIGNLLAFLVPAIINHIELTKFFKVKVPIIKQAITPIISSIIMTFVIYIIKVPVLRSIWIISEGALMTRLLIGLATFVLVAIGGVVYLYIMVCFGGIRKKDLDIISPKLYKVMPRSIRRQLL